MFDVNAAGRGQLYTGSQFFVLARGVDAYTKHRYGEAVTGKCGEATVSGVIESMQIAPLGAFFNNGGNFGPLLGRPYDARSLTDAVEAQFKRDAKDVTAIDPREIYTAIHVRVESLADPVLEPIAQ